RRAPPPKKEKSPPPGVVRKRKGPPSGGGGGPSREGRDYGVCGAPRPARRRSGGGRPRGGGARGAAGARGGGRGRAREGRGARGGGGVRRGRRRSATGRRHVVLSGPARLVLRGKDQFEVAFAEPMARPVRQQRLATGPGEEAVDLGALARCQRRVDVERT